MNEISHEPRDFEMKEQTQPKFWTPFNAPDVSMHSVSQPPSKKRITDVAMQELQVDLHKLSLDKSPQAKPVDALPTGAQKNSGVKFAQTPRSVSKISEFPKSDNLKPSPRRATPHPIKQVEVEGKEHPSFYREFVECSSKYDLPHKEDSEEISDNVEFAEAKHIRTYDQDATEVLAIEHEIEARDHGMPFTFNAKQAKANGVKSKRDKNFKYFTEVGYTGEDNRLIPRWAIDQNKLKKIMHFQREVLNPDDIFGKWGPKVVAEHFKQEIIFSKGSNQERYMEMQDDNYKFRFEHQKERGSSEKWNDHSEFVTPIPEKRGPNVSAVKIGAFQI